MCHRAEGKLNEDNSSSAFGFSIKRDGDKLTIKSTSSNRFASVGDIEYRFTFDDGVVSSSGGKVEGNTSLPPTLSSRLSVSLVAAPAF